jgi:hypothetical protein
MAVMNKSLTLMNKSADGGRATNEAFGLHKAYTIKAEGEDLSSTFPIRVNADHDRLNRAELISLIEASRFEIVSQLIPKLTKDERKKLRQQNK